MYKYLEICYKHTLQLSVRGAAAIFPQALLQKCEHSQGSLARIAVSLSARRQILFTARCLSRTTNCSNSHLLALTAMIDSASGLNNS